MNREEAKKELLTLLGYYINTSDITDISDPTTAIDMAIEALKEKPHGKWDRGFCSVCGKRSLRTTQTGEIFGIEHTPFCKNCGADMRTKDGKICETMRGW